MLHVTLAPATVPTHEVLQGRRRFLETAIKGSGEVHAPAPAPQHRSLDDVVAHDMAAERLAALKDR